MADTSPNDVLDPDGRDFMARNTLTHAKQYTNEDGNPKTCNQATVEKWFLDGSAKKERRIDDKEDIEFGDLISAESTVQARNVRTFNEYDIAFLEEEDFQWDTQHQNRRLEFSSNFHSREAMGSENRLKRDHVDLGQRRTDSDGTLGVFTDPISGNDRSSFSEDHQNVLGDDKTEVHASDRDQYLNSTGVVVKTFPNHRNKLSPASRSDAFYGNSLNVSDGVRVVNFDAAGLVNGDANIAQNMDCYKYMQLEQNHRNHVSHVDEFRDGSDSESGSWHCHSQEMPKYDKVARNQLIAVCTLCSLFMIGETVGKKLRLESYS